MKNTYNFSVQVRNFLLPLSLKVFRHKEREAQSFYAGVFICAAPPSHVTPAQVLREQAKVNPFCSVSSLNSLTFFKFPKSSVRFQCVTSSALCNPVSHLGYCDIFEWHVCSACARAWIPMLILHLTNPCAELKGSQPN